MEFTLHSVYKKYSQVLFTLLPNVSTTLSLFNWLPFCLGVTQSEKAQKFESASSLLADLRWNSLENQSVNSVQVFQASNSGVETVTNSFLMHKVFCIRQGDTLYIFFISVQRKAEAHKIKLLVNYFKIFLFEMVLWNFKFSFLFLHKTIGSYFSLFILWVNDWSLCLPQIVVFSPRGIVNILQLSLKNVKWGNI